MPDVRFTHWKKSNTQKQCDPVFSNSAPPPIPHPQGFNTSLLCLRWTARYSITRPFLQPSAAHLRKDVLIPLVGTHKKLEAPSWLGEMCHWPVTRCSFNPGTGQIQSPRLQFITHQGNGGTDRLPLLLTICECHFKKRMVTRCGGAHL